MNKRILPLTLSLLMIGCAVGPDYKKPVLDTPSTFRSSTETNTTEDKKLDEEAWWLNFNDPSLNKLVEQALNNNRDIQIAIARVRKAGGELQTVTSQFFPQVSLNAGIDRGLGKGAAVDYLTPTSNTPPTTMTIVQAPVAWQIDIFGGIRRQVEASTAIQKAMIANREAVSQTVVATVVNHYIVLRSLDRQLEVAEKTLKNYMSTLKIFELRLKYGTANEVQVAQIQSQVDQAEAAIPPLRKAIKEEENNINALLGGYPGTIARGKPINELLIAPPPTGLTSALLERRPDIRLAEEELIASNAEIGVAVAQYFPTFGLTASGGAVSAVLMGAVSGPVGIWAIGGLASLPIFTAGRIAGQVTAAKAENSIALAAYMKTVEGAFRDVDNSLVANTESRELVKARMKQVKTLQKYANLASMQFNYGYTDYLTVLNAEDSLFQAELQLAQAQAQQASAAVNLYLNLGGGWKATDTAALKNNEHFSSGEGALPNGVVKKQQDQ